MSRPGPLATGADHPPAVVLVSVQGRPGLPAAALAELETVAKVTAVARGEQPRLTGRQAAELFADAQLVAVTPKVTPDFDDALLDRLPQLRGVCLHATGTDLYDLEVFRRRGLALATLPAYSTISVAEHALALLLTLSRRVHLAHDRSRAAVPAGTSLRGFELSGRTLGIIGLGRIGAHVARLGAAFGMTVVGHDPRPRAVPGVVGLGLEELLERSDAVVVACSRHLGDPALLGLAELSLLPAGAVVVTVSRAAVVDTAAVVQLVRSGHLRGYGVDDVVLDPAQDGDLLAQGRVVQTGHSAWWSDEVLERGAQAWVDGLLAMVLGGPLHLAVDPPGWEPLLAGAGAVLDLTGVGVPG